MSSSLPASAPPFPLRLPTPDRRALRRRATRIVTVVARYLGPPVTRRLVRAALPAQAFARPLRRVFETLGATFVKFGQLVASAPGAFGDVVADEFRSCLDTGPSVPFAEVRAAVELALGAPLATAFAEFEEIPIGRASIAVVHRARLHDGRAVAVKVLRPDIEAIVATDLRLMDPLFEFLAFRVGVPEAGQLVRMLDGFREQLAEELDLRNEARAMEHHRGVIAALDGRVGVVDWGIVGRLDARTHRFLRRTIEGALGDASAWDDIAADLFAAYGPALREGLGLDEKALAAFSRAMIEPMLTRPFGEASPGSFLAAMQGKIAEAEGRVVERRGVHGALARFRRQRRLHVGVEEYGGRGSAFDRGTFLLAKQLLYFERDGKMFLGDTSLLADRAFIEDLLRAGPLSV